MNGQPYARLNTFHGPKRQILGNQAGLAPPAWRTNVVPMSGQGPAGRSPAAMEQGSKIFLSRLPGDVAEKEVEELFKKTVGPLKESFLIYNSQGKSKGMAIVSFQRPGDAAVARTKYDGKIVDGRRPLKIEVIVDEALPTVTTPPPPPPQMPSLLYRLGEKALTNRVSSAPTPIPTQPRAQQKLQRAIPPPPLTVGAAPTKRRYKKGPKRIKKQYIQPTRDQLDKEMEDYRAAADTLGL